MKIIERFVLILNEIHDLNPDALVEYILDNLMPLIRCNDNDKEHSANDILTLITAGDRNVPIILPDKCAEIPILFVVVSETGAMGTPGEFSAITVADDKALIFKANYLYGDINEDDVIKMYPPISEYFSKGILSPDVVHYDCGCGNHQNIGDENLGYTFGVLADGTPFEADLWLDGNDRNISVYMPENRGFISEDNKEHDITKQPYLITKIQCHWNSVLSIGMVERDIEADTDELLSYVDYLINNEIICFTTNVQNGRLGFLTDVEGNDLVCVSIALDEEGLERAKTSLHFRPFPNQPQKSFSKYNNRI